VALVFILQLFFMSQIHRQNEQANTCSHGRPSLQLVCVFVFFVSMFKELLHAGTLFELLWYCPVQTRALPRYAGLPGTADVQHGAVLQKQASKGAMASLMRWAGAPGSRKHVWSLEHMTTRWKTVCFGLVAVPRLLIGCVLTWVGAGFIMKSAESNIIFDTLSCVFIVDLSALIYGAFTTEIVKEKMEEAHAVEKYPSNAHRLAMFLFSSFIHPALVVLFTATTVKYWRKECSQPTHGAGALPNFPDMPSELQHGFNSVMELFAKQ